MSLTLTKPEASLSADFPIGTVCHVVRSKKDQHKNPETVVDILRTYNSAGELVKVRYVTARPYVFGQLLYDYDVHRNTIARYLVSVPEVD